MPDRWAPLINRSLSSVSEADAGGEERHGREGSRYKNPSLVLRAWGLHGHGCGQDVSSFWQVTETSSASVSLSVNDK